MTIPHKEAALAVADEASRAAQEIGAANTLSFAGGRIRAENTDATGLLAALPGPVDGKDAPWCSAPEGRRGRRSGRSRGRALSVSVWNRTAQRADELVRDLADAGAGTAAEGRLAPVTADQARPGPSS